MTRKEKLIKRFLTRPKDFTWDELVLLLSFFQFSEVSTGKTGGSRRRFINEEGLVISLHKPHSRKILKKYQIEQVMDILEQEGLL
ncbi:type II toxin-antitoxin system HicA family toxin [Acaryochloris marina NIES-2412]|uniref:type II toxin-antitoxin system HicA family toxin n=1 Tax=Acaryochloris marina TaxID=155978 RepID=UPI004059128F